MVFRVLALHGSQQNAEALRTRLGRIVPKLKKYAAFIYLDAPHILPLRDGDEVSYRTWYSRCDSTTLQATLVKSLLVLLDFWNREGPFDGIFGFSQGGAVASLMASRQDLFPGLKFIMIVGSPDIENLHYSNVGRLIQTKKVEEKSDKKFDIKSLHFAGTADKIVSVQESQILASRFESSEFYEHEQGHCIPTKSIYIATMITFLESILVTKISSIASSTVDIPNLKTSVVNDLKMEGNKNQTEDSTIRCINGLRKENAQYIGKLVSNSDNVGGRNGSGGSDNSIMNDVVAKSSRSGFIPKQNLEKEAAIIEADVAQKKQSSCTSESNASEQRDEIEALTAIYTNTEIQIVRPPPLNSNMSSGCISIMLTAPPHAADREIPTAQNKTINQRWQGELRLLIDFPPGYPEDPGSDPIIDIDVGNLSMMEFPSSLRNVLRNNVREVAKQCSGSCCAFECIQAANDWLASEGWKNILNESRNIPIDKTNQINQVMCLNVAEGNTVPVSKEEQSIRTLIQEINANGWIPRKPNDILQKNEKSEEELKIEREKEIEEEERREREYIKIATDEACHRAAAIINRRNTINLVNKYARGDVGHLQGSSTKQQTDSDDEVELEELKLKLRIEPSHSARGVWSYTVGLVGKPSAGKSTFYNAATCAALRGGDGRKMAEVAPHPFTTIEPNIGPGWFAGPQDNKYDQGRVTAYGRDSTDRRLLPVLIKDVAGLVPGAYKGRGKGNRFLADLCDADVLVHVVDATGRSDRDGNALGGHEIGSTPSEDAQWIREELHRWIHGNIRAKWPSVCRRGMDSAERVVELFTGYKGPRSCVELASIRGRLSLSSAPTWTSLDMHRFVAHYLTIRFPICLALNKIDAFPDNSSSEKSENTTIINDRNDIKESDSHTPMKEHVALVNDNKNQTKCDKNYDNGKNKNKQVDGGRGIVRICQLQAVQRGELAVPVSAFAENWSILKQAYLQSQLLTKTKHVHRIPVTLNASEEIIPSVHEAVRTYSNANSNYTSTYKNGTNGINNDNDNDNNNDTNNNNGTKGLSSISTTSGKTGNLNFENEDESNKKEEIGKESGTKSTFPAMGSRLWDENEATLERVKKIWRTTGVLEAVSAAVSIKPPVYCYPVSDLETESPIGWTYGMQVMCHTNSNSNNMSYPISSEGEGNTKQHSNISIGIGSDNYTQDPPRLRDCILLQPGSTVGDVYEALKRGAIPHVTVHGDFVRAEAKGLNLGFDERIKSSQSTASASCENGSKKTFKKKQLGRDVVIDETCCIIRIQTNRKSIWQQSSVTAVEAAAAATSVIR